MRRDGSTEWNGDREARRLVGVQVRGWGGCTPVGRGVYIRAWAGVLAQLGIRDMMRRCYGVGIRGREFG